MSEQGTIMRAYKTHKTKIGRCAMMDGRSPAQRRHGFTYQIRLGRNINLSLLRDVCLEVLGDPASIAIWTTSELDKAWALDIRETGFRSGMKRNLYLRDLGDLESITMMYAMRLP